MSRHTTTSQDTDTGKGEDMASGEPSRESTRAAMADEDLRDEDLRDDELTEADEDPLDAEHARSEWPDDDEDGADADTAPVYVPPTAVATGRLPAYTAAGEDRLADQRSAARSAADVDRFGDQSSAADEDRWADQSSAAGEDRWADSRSAADADRFGDQSSPVGGSTGNTPAMADLAETGYANAYATGAAATTATASGTAATTATAPGAAASTGTGHAERMREIQLGFVDNPRGCAEEADRLIEDLVDALAADLAQRRRELGGAAADGAAPSTPSTEQLRLAVRRDRELVELLEQARQLSMSASA